MDHIHAIGLCIVLIIRGQNHQLGHCFLVDNFPRLIRKCFEVFQCVEVPEDYLAPHIGQPFIEAPPYCATSFAFELASIVLKYKN